MGGKMFCWQCQEMADGRGCTVSGVCGTKPDVAAMQDLLIYVTKGLSAVTTALRGESKEVGKEINHLVTMNLFITITNANFDREAIEAKIRETLSAKRELLSRISDKEGLPEAALWDGGAETFAEKAAQVGILSTENEDIRSLRELILYGLKGLAAYSKHANALLYDDESVDAFIQKALSDTLNNNLTVDNLIALTLETGKYGVAGMALLDKANTSAYGNPEITEEIREYYQTQDIGWITQRSEWVGLKSIGMDMHWYLDVTFREDANHTIDKNSAQNLNIIRKFCLSVLKLVEILHPRLSMKKKRFAIAQNTEKYLESVLNF